MKRTKRSNDISHVASDFLRVGMWQITSKKNPNIPDIKEQIFRYGSGKGSGVVIVRGGVLLQKDRDVWYIVESFDRANGRQGVKGHISDITKAKGVKNPHAKTNMDSVRDSLNRLLDVHVRIRPNHREGSLSAGFTLLEGKIDDSGCFDLRIGYYRELVEKQKLFEVRVPLMEHFSIRSGIGRNLKDLIKYQASLYSKKGYSISLLKLCKYIGYNTSRKPIWQIWPHIKHSIEELKGLRIIDKYKYEKDKENGGLLTFWKKEKPPKQQQKNNDTNNDHLIVMVQEFFPDTQDDIQLRNGLNKIRRHLENEYNITKPDKVIEDYLDIVSRKASYFDVKLLYPGNSFFKQYEKEFLHSKELHWDEEKGKYWFISYGEKYYMDEEGVFRNREGRRLKF